MTFSTLFRKMGYLFSTSRPQQRPPEPGSSYGWAVIHDDAMRKTDRVLIAIPYVVAIAMLGFTLIPVMQRRYSWPILVWPFIWAITEHRCYRWFRAYQECMRRLEYYNNAMKVAVKGLKGWASASTPKE